MKRYLCNRWTLTLVALATGWVVADRWAGTVGSVALRAGIAEVRYRFDTGGSAAAEERMATWQAALKSPGAMLKECERITEMNSLSEIRRLYALADKLPDPWKMMMSAALARRWMQLDPESALLKSITDPGPAGGAWRVLFAREWAGSMSTAELSNKIGRLTREMSGPWKSYLENRGDHVGQDVEGLCKLMGAGKVWAVMQSGALQVPDRCYQSVFREMARDQNPDSLRAMAENLPEGARNAALNGISQTVSDQKREEIIKNATAENATEIYKANKNSYQTLYSLAEGFGKRDPEGARAWARENLEGANLYSFIGAQTQALQGDPVAKALSLEESARLGMGKANGFDAVNFYVNHDPETTALGKDPQKLEELRAAGAVHMAGRLRQQYLAQSGDYQTLIAELPEIGGGVTMQAGNKAVTDAVVQGWPESQTWIQNLPAETRERFAEPVLAGLLATDPAAAAAFYSGLQSPGNAATAFKSNRGYPPRDIIERIASAWAMENAPAARQWVASLPDANQRAAAEKALQK